ncbi:MAG: UDP-glucose/GDP-mannose dehydrogenase family protein, partial [Candidatus Aenigmatarchaeota archaeon]
RLNATTDLKKAVDNSEIIFICVGTPSDNEGAINLRYIKEVAKDLGTILKNIEDYKVVVVKSSVVPSTTEEMVIPLLEEYSGKKAGKDFGVCTNPEFLREGLAVEDTLDPDRVVIGELDKKSGDVLYKLYENFECPILRVSLRTAEMIKYASNNFLATKISFINEISNICEKLDIDVHEVSKGIGLDERIGPHFLHAGVGFGGSCLPKDSKALIKLAENHEYDPELLKSVLGINKQQRLKVIEKAKSMMDLDGKTISILGLAFKPETDDIRESPAITVVEELLKENVNIRAYDPKAMENFKHITEDIYYAEDVDDALKNSDLCIILTDWNEFRNIYENVLEMDSPRVIDGRMLLDRERAEELDIEYKSV